MAGGSSHTIIILASEGAVLLKFFFLPQSSNIMCVALLSIPISPKYQTLQCDKCFAGVWLSCFCLCVCVCVCACVLWCVCVVRVCVYVVCCVCGCVNLHVMITVHSTPAFFCAHSYLLVPNCVIDCMPVSSPSSQSMHDCTEFGCVCTHQAHPRSP